MTELLVYFERRDDNCGA